MSLAINAMLFAMDKHKDQKRKYTNNPYTDHLAEVAGIVATIPMFGIEYYIATAWLHDTMEDQGVTWMELCVNFDITIASAVQKLSDLEEGNRETRKRLSRERLAEADELVQNVKVADLISNTSSIVQHDPKFAKVYLEEKRLLLPVLTKAHPALLDIAWNQCKEFV